MAKNHRIFISFAIEDSKYRDFVVGQAKNGNSPFEFVDMSVKEPWEDQWKTKCRTKIRGCDGMIALVSQNTAAATGALWEVACATDEDIPIIGVYIDSENKPWVLPNEFSGVKVVNWTWANIKAFIDTL